MKAWIWGSVAVIVAMGASLLSVLALRNIDWLQGLMIFFTYYGAALLLLALYSRRRNFLKNDCYRPFVTVLIPARNEENVIEATVRSMCRMHYRKNGRFNFEVVVVDDASIDQTVPIMHRLCQEFSMVRL